MKRYPCCAEGIQDGAIYCRFRNHDFEGTGSPRAEPSASCDEVSGRVLAVIHGRRTASQRLAREVEVLECGAQISGCGGPKWGFLDFWN